MIEFPTSIKENNLSALKPNAESIKYLITNLDNGMMYSGSHKLYEKGVFPDGYWNSSRNSEFINLFYGMKPMLKYEIIDSGDHAEMKNLERDFHKKEDVMNNPLFYNLANAGGAYVVPVRGELCKHIVQLIKDGKFRVDELRRVDDLNKLPKLQVRFEVKPVDQIANRMKEKGDASNADPILVWEVDEGMIGDGNRTLEGATIAKIPLVRINLIPASFIKEHDINQDEMERVGQLLNPVEFFEKEPTDDETVIETLLRYNKDHGTPIDASSNKEYIDDIGFTHQKRNQLISKAQDRKDLNDINAAGKTCIRYPQGKKDSSIVKNVESLTDDDTIVITGSAGSPLRLFVDTFDEIEKKTNWQTIIIKPYYDKESNRKAWEGYWKVNEKTKVRTWVEGYKVDFERRLSVLLEYSPTTEDGIPRNIVIDHMPHYQEKITKS